MLEKRATYSVSMMERVLEVSRAHFYRWLKAKGGEDLWGPIKEAICAIWEESDRRFSFRKVWSKLTGDPKLRKIYRHDPLPRAQVHG